MKVGREPARALRSLTQVESPTGYWQPGGPGRLAVWHFPGGPVGPPAWWAATSNVAEGSGTEEEAQGLVAGDGWLYSNKLFAGTPSS